MNEEARIASIARRHIVFGLTFAVIGMALGIYMAISQNHGQHPTHAHILLIGFVVSTLYAIVYRLWLQDTSAKLATVQTVLHQLGAVLIVTGLFLLYGGVVNPAKLEPVLAIGSISVLTGAALMLYQVVNVRQAAQSSRRAAIAAERAS